jgi:hypothetical protein
VGTAGTAAVPDPDVGAFPLRAIRAPWDRRCLSWSVPTELRHEDLAGSFAEVGAVRAGDALTGVQMRELPSRLEGLDIWRYCLHGRAYRSAPPIPRGEWRLGGVGVSRKSARFPL